MAEVSDEYMLTESYKTIQRMFSKALHQQLKRKFLNKVVNPASVIAKVKQGGYTSSSSFQYEVTLWKRSI